MKFQDEYRNAGLCQKIAAQIRDTATRDMTIMEVCGGHTMAIRKNGIHKIVGSHVRLLSGPGCPVCVTAMVDIDLTIELVRKHKIALCTFGDLFYVPGTYSSLAREKASGADIRIVYSVDDAVTFAQQEPDKQFVFVSIGFETTTPTVAAAIMHAQRLNISNLSIVGLNKTMPHALRAILSHKDSRIDGLMCPGHVSTITGLDMYRFIPDEFGISCCISGFEPSDILHSILLLVNQIQSNGPALENAYPRAVRSTGNEKAQAMVDEVFEACDAAWRGLGIIPQSGLALRSAYTHFDALNRFAVSAVESNAEKGCMCGDLLRGLKLPTDCGLFAKVCTPSNPQGACMVSSEGSCAAWYRYGAE